MYWHTLIQGPLIYPSNSYPLSLALQLLENMSIPLLWKTTSIIMASKLIAMLAFCNALSQPIADFSADILAVFHILYVLAEGGCGHITTNWGLLYSDFGFGSYHTGVSQTPAHQASSFHIVFLAFHPFFFKQSPRFPTF